jgi:hypothetical protein
MERLDETMVESSELACRQSKVLERKLGTRSFCICGVGLTVADWKGGGLISRTSWIPS